MAGNYNTGNLGGDLRGLMPSPEVIALTTITGTRKVVKELVQDKYLKVDGGFIVAGDGGNNAATIASTTLYPSLTPGSSLSTAVKCLIDTSFGEAERIGASDLTAGNINFILCCAPGGFPQATYNLPYADIARLLGSAKTGTIVSSDLTTPWDFSSLVGHDFQVMQIWGSMYEPLTVSFAGANGDQTLASTSGMEFAYRDAGQPDKTMLITTSITNMFANQSQGQSSFVFTNTGEIAVTVTLRSTPGLLWTQISGVSTWQAVNAGALYGLDATGGSTVALTAGDRIGYVSSTQTYDWPHLGIYEVVDPGSDATQAVIKRAPDASTPAGLCHGMTFQVTGGTGVQYNGYYYTLTTADPVVIDSTALAFSSSTTYQGSSQYELLTAPQLISENANNIDNLEFSISAAYGVASAPNDFVTIAGTPGVSVLPADIYKFDIEGAVVTPYDPIYRTVITADLLDVDNANQVILSAESDSITGTFTSLHFEKSLSTDYLFSTTRRLALRYGVRTNSRNYVTVRFRYSSPVRGTYVTLPFQMPGSAVGINGAPGSKWYEGAGVPDAELGTNGDYYLNTSNGDVYTKISNSWTWIANLTGPTDPGVVYANPALTTGRITLAVEGTHNGHDIGDSYIRQVNITPFAALNQTNRDWRAISVAPNGNVYSAVYGLTTEYIYMQTAGSGNFTAVSGSGQANGWAGVACAPNGNIYGTTVAVNSVNGAIWMQTQGTGSFVNLNQADLPWQSITVAPNGDVYAAAYNDYIYKQTGGVGNFVQVASTPVANYDCIAAAPNGDIYAGAWGNGYLYKQAAGTVGFSIDGPAKQWRAITVAPNGDIYAAIGSDSIYVRRFGSSTWTSLGVSQGSYWIGVGAAPNGNIYASVQHGDIYEQLSGSICVGTNLAVGGAVTGSSLLVAPGYIPDQWKLFTESQDPILAIIGNSLLFGGVTIKGIDVNEAFYTVQITDYALEVRYTATGAVSIQLPAISSVLNGRLILSIDSGYNASNNNITLVRAGSDKINNVSGNYTQSVSGSTIRLKANVTTSNWEII